MEKINKSSIAGFTEKVILSTSKEDKKIFLWDENNRSIIYTYEDSNIKTYLSQGGINILGQDLYSEYIVALQENKSLVTIWKTSQSEPLLKSTPVDERITAICASNDNKLLYLGTETGNLFIHELFTGNIQNAQVSTEKVVDIKTGLKDSVIFCLCEDYFKVILLESILANRDINPLQELPNNDSYTNITTIGFPVKYIILNSVGKVSIYSFPGLKLIKTLYIDDTIVSLELDKWNLFAFFIFCENKVLNIDITDLTKDNASTNLQLPAPIIVTETKIRSACVSLKFILTGHDDGMIFIWDRISSNVYKHINTFQQHKGTITNILSINRPISQYGLNFNTTIDEIIVKPLKKQNAANAGDITIRKSAIKDDFIEKFLNKKIKRNLSYKPTDQLDTNTTTTKPKNNMDDVTFLKRKVNELYSLLNNK
jgi:WD40 repeat protein